MENCKLQFGCLLVVAYIAFIYIRERRAYNVKKKEPLFVTLLILGMASIVFDASTAYTVNHLEQVNSTVNRLLHLFFLLSLDAQVFMMFLYLLSITKGPPVRTRTKIIIFSPLVLNVIIVILYIPQLSYIHGKTTNYSMGVSVYTCFIMVVVYVTLSIITFIHSWKNLDRNKRISISTYISFIVGVSFCHLISPEVLITSLVPTFAVLAAYLNQENPTFVRLREYHREMVMGFATLVENRDDNTGGHIHRTTEYVELLAGELKERGYYSGVLTKDYIKNLVLAAPMHDVGKIAIPDAVLQKPGKLTDDEYALMKTHAERGGRIIKETFGKMGDAGYEEIAYEVARHHHEKWNGRGYPDGLSGNEIPVCARIMAIADVFDAVSAKRCYRDALPLDVCFGIIEEGSGQDFDPVMAEVFLEMKDRIMAVYESNMRRN